MYKKMALMALLVSLLFSCKKESTSSSIPEDPKQQTINSISYSQFIGAINLDRTGILRSALLDARKSDRKSHSIVTIEQFGLQIDTTRVKKLTLGDTTCYVLALSLTSPRAVNFENLTIQIVGSKTTAFLTTYIPAKEWITARKENKHIQFKGDIVISKILLKGSTTTEIHNTRETKTMSTMPKAMTIGGARIELAPGECEIYEVVQYAGYTCSTGCELGTCPWDNGSRGGWIEGVSYLASYSTTRSYEIECAPVAAVPPPGSMPPPPSGGGDGSGGTTTPNLPGGYDPCDCNPPVAVSSINFVEAVRVMVAQGNCCDGNQPSTPPPPPPSPYYSDEEFKEIINTLYEPVTADGIELYIVLRHTGSKLIDLSRYSIIGNSITAGEYTLVPHYDQTSRLIFYSATRLFGRVQNGIEYIIRADQLNNFKNKIDYYTSAANLVYMNGIPDKGMIQMMGGNRVDGLLGLWTDAISSPEYWIHLASLYVASINSGNVAIKNRVNTITAGRNITLIKEITIEVNLPERVRASGMTNAQAGKFFGWGTGVPAKGLNDFTKSLLESNGWTENVTKSVAEGYRRIGNADPLNPSAAARAAQLESLLTLF